jgi:hypothetical protein
MPTSGVVMANENPGSEPKSWLEKNWMPMAGLMTVAGGLYIMGFGADGKAAIIAPLVTLVLGYAFGTGAGSQAKDKIIAAIKGGNG